MSVYIVVATTEAKIERCEAYAGAQAALGRAFQLASDKAKGNINLVDTSPEEEHLTDGFIRWTFMETSKQSVAVFYLNVEEALFDSRDPRNVIAPVLKDTSDNVPLRGTLHGNVPIHVPPMPLKIKDGFKLVDAAKYISDGLPYGAGGNLAKALFDMNLLFSEWSSLVIDLRKLPTELVISSFFNSFLQMVNDRDQEFMDAVRDTVWLTNFDFQSENIDRWMKEFKPLPPPFDFEDRGLPAGWNLDGEPILMSQFLDQPDDAKDPKSLTENEKWALVTARIRKSPNFAVIPDGLSGYIPSRNDSLKAVEERTDLGKRVRDGELNRLSALLGSASSVSY